MKIEFLLHIIFISCIYTVNAQDSHFINYSTNDGLPSREVYDIEVDESGLIWFSTDRGVCTFDGLNFKTYTTQDGLADNVNFEIFKDSQERLWFNGYGGGITIFENGQFRHLSNNDSLINILNGQWTSNILESEDGRFYSTKFRLFEDKYEIISLNPETFPKELDRNKIDSVFKVIQTSGTAIIPFGNYGFVINTNEGNIGYTYSTIASKSFNNWFFQNGKKVYKYNEIDKSSTQYTFNNKIGNLYLDKKNNLWVCTQKGLFYFSGGSLNQTPTHYFKDKNITSIVEDQEGTFWVSCIQNGIYHIPTLDVTSIDIDMLEKTNKSYFAIGSLDHHIAFGGKDSKVLIIDTLGNSENYSLSNKLTDIRYISESEGALFTPYDRISENGGEIQITKEKRRFYGIARTLSNNHFFRVSSGRGFLIYDSDGNNIYQSLNAKPIFSAVITSIIEVDKTIWIGTLKGLYRIKNYNYSEIELVLVDGENVFGRVNHISEDHFGNCWVATIGNGLFYHTGNKTFTVKKKDGLISDMVNRILVLNDSTVCLATNKGVNFLNYKFENDTLIILKKKSLTISDGLISNFINDIKFWRGKIWLATDNGICNFGPEYLDKSFPEIPVSIKELVVNDSLYDITQDLTFEHDKNDIYINYAGISFLKGNEKSYYRYRLSSDNKNSKWFYTTEKSIRYNNMSSGNYTFEVAAKNKSNVWTQTPATISFKIKPHFSETLWFRIFSLLLIVSIVGAGIKMQFKRIQLREYEKRKLQEAELNALRNQMNPHFVFNSLNSIQNFIFKRDIEKANYYLSKFSKLMRSSLQYSRLDFITLREEVTFVKNYLELEVMRFSGKFEYDIEIQDSLDLDFIKVPSLLIQPVLENSIKHAFNNIEYLGLLKIEIRERDEYSLHVYVTDNGSGFPKDSEDKSALDIKYKSLGLKIIKNRIALLNKSYVKTKASIDFINLSDNNDDKIGLQVHFVLPIKNK